MKDKIHPQLFDVNVHCTCGNEFVTRSTKSEMRVEVCSACHSFFTGKHRIMDTAGRVEKFNRKYTKKNNDMNPSSTTTVNVGNEAVTDSAVIAQ